MCARALRVPRVPRVPLENPVEFRNPFETACVERYTDYMGSMVLPMFCTPIGKHMEKRKLIRVSPKGIGFYTWKLWRITKGVTKAETGKLRLRLYYKGKLIPHSRTLCSDVPEAEHVAIRWTGKYHEYFIGSNIYSHGSAPMMDDGNGRMLYLTPNGWEYWRTGRTG